MTRYPDRPQSIARLPQRQTLEQLELRDILALIARRGRLAALPRQPQHPTSHSVQRADARRLRLVEVACELLRSAAPALEQIGFHEWL